MRRSKTAHEKFKEGQKQDAIQTLEAYVQQVNIAQLSDNARSNELRRPAEMRIQQYKTLIAESAIAKVGSGQRYYSRWDEGKHQAEIQKRQQEVAALVKEADDLYKQGKLKESELIGRKILAIDPENTAAVYIVMTSQTKRRQEEYDKDTHTNDDNFIDLLKHYTIPKYMSDPDKKLVGFDPDHTRRHDRRWLHSARAQGSQGTGHRVSLEAADQSEFQQHAAARRDHQHLGPERRPSRARSAALQEAHVNLEAPLSGSADNINMKNALNILLKPMHLSYIIEDQVLKITTEDRTDGRLVRITYPIADLIVPVEDHPLPHSIRHYASAAASRSVGGCGTVRQSAVEECRLA